MKNSGDDNGSSITCVTSYPTTETYPLAYLNYYYCASVICSGSQEKQLVKKHDLQTIVSNSLRAAINLVATLKIIRGA